ncbi:MAG: CBS domain-containing protein, partial [Acidimicrobiia bacterium]
DDYFMRHNYNSFPVTSDHHTLGLVSMKAIREVARERWDRVLVDEILEPLSEMCTVGVTDDIGNVVDKLMQGEVGRVVVVDHDEVIGLITPRDVVRWLELTQELGESERRLRLR